MGPLLHGEEVGTADFQRWRCCFKVSQDLQNSSLSSFPRGMGETAAGCHLGTDAFRIGWVKMKSLKGLLSLSEFTNRGVFSLYTHSAGWGWRAELRLDFFSGLEGCSKVFWGEIKIEGEITAPRGVAEINVILRWIPFARNWYSFNYCKSSPKSSNYCSVNFVNVTLGHMDLPHFTFIKLGIYQCFGGL